MPTELLEVGCEGLETMDAEYIRSFLVTNQPLYRPGQRRSKTVRVFLDFLIEVFAELEGQRPAEGSIVPRMPRPEWFGRAHGRQSAFATRRPRAAL
jgi:hypothetical protein